MEVMIGGRMEPVTVTRKKMKNITLRVGKDGEILVSCPWFVSMKDVEKFLYQNEGWILNRQLARKREVEINREGVGESVIYWLGEKKQVIYESAGRDSMLVDGDTVIFRLREKREDRIETVFRRTANRKLLALAEEERGTWDALICQANGLQVPEIRTRYMVSRWGVCYPSKHVITLSTRLIHYPKPCFEYVLLHEYTHFLVPNHSRAFYEIVERNMPDYRQRRKLLK